MKSPTVVSVTTINGGSRFNIVPDTVDMTGTIRTYDAGVRALAMVTANYLAAAKTD
jgi:metal-dependent amidase/aminoacylase/carboxypeptidase family protein